MGQSKGEGEPADSRTPDDLAAPEMIMNDPGLTWAARMRPIEAKARPLDRPPGPSKPPHHMTLEEMDNRLTEGAFGIEACKVLIRSGKDSQ